MKNRYIKLLSVLLCCVLLAGLLPATALAWEQRDVNDEVIYNVDILLDVPEAGKPLDFTPVAGHDTYEIVADNAGEDVSWQDITTGEWLEPGHVAEYGKTYCAIVDVTTENGRCFKQDPLTGKYVTDATINGSDEEDVRISTKYYLDGAARITAYFHMPAIVDTVEVLGIEAPFPGMTPDHSAAAADEEHYEVCSSAAKGNFYTGVYWYDVTDGKVLKPYDTFVDGHTYRVFIDLLTTELGIFATNANGSSAVTATVDGKAASVTKYMNEAMSGEINVYCDYLCENAVLDSVGVTGLNVPKEGELPDYSVEVVGEGYAPKDTNNVFVKNGVSWYDETGGYDMTATDEFIAGHAYTAVIYLVPSTGYEFASSADGTVNGTSASVTKNGNMLELRYAFTALETNKITKVELEGINEPMLGKAPGYVAIVKGEGYALKDRSDFYYRNGICWSIMDSSDLPTDGTAMFEGGKKYQVTFYLVAEDGYEFATNASGGLMMTASLDGRTAQIVGGNKDEIVVTCYFPEPVENDVLTEAAVMGIDAPAIGASPDYTADIVDIRYALADRSSLREKNGITWIDNSTGSAMVVGADKFEAGVSYSVVVGVTAADGYEFHTDLLGAPQITGSINGELVDVSGQDEFTAYLTYTFEALPEETEQPSETPETPETPTEPENPETPESPDSPETPETPEPIEMVFVDVPENFYYFEPIYWAVQKGITNGTTATTFEPELTCSQAHILTFLWRAVGSPEPTIASPYSNVYVVSEQYFYKPFVWAWEKGLISNTALDPFAPCSRSDVVTYLWKLEGRPTAEDADFVDVPDTAEYAPAVAWAVAVGVTNGTSATEFSPDDTCTRGQIVTFLWRYMHK